MTASTQLKSLFAGLATVAVVGAAIAQSTPPNPNVSNPAVGAGQQSTQNTPMGTTGVQGAGGSASTTTGASSGAGSTMGTNSNMSNNTGSSTGSSTGTMGASGDMGTGTTRNGRAMRSDRN